MAAYVQQVAPSHEEQEPLFLSLRPSVYPSVTQSVDIDDPLHIHVCVCVCVCVCVEKESAVCPSQRSVRADTRRPQTSSVSRKKRSHWSVSEEEQVLVLRGYVLGPEEQERNCSTK